MDPQIRYTKTSDGVSIAYWTMGEGPPLVVFPPLGYSHIQLELQYPELRAWFERLAASRMVVRFDLRGQGMSQRHLAEIPPDAFLRDFDAVVESLGLEELDLWVMGVPAIDGCWYAVKHPERVRRLVTFCALTSTTYTRDDPELAAVWSLADKEWRVFTETLAQTLLGFTDPARAHAWAQFMRRSVSQDDFGLLVAADYWTDFDFPDMLRQVSCPTMVMHRTSWRPGSIDDAHLLAATIPDARLALFEGSFPLPLGVAEDEIFEAMDEFLGGTAGRAPRPRTKTTPSATAIILFADIAESTALTERLGDAAFRDKARALDDALRRAIASNGGQAIDGKLLGDGVLAVFGAAREAIACAQACHDAAGGVELALHIGVHAGDVIRENDNVYGGAVNIAARVASEAAAGETLVSATVRDLARTSAGVLFEDRGERELKGVGEPVRVWAVV